jgi:hypothetical protein
MSANDLDSDSTRITLETIFISNFIPIPEGNVDAKAHQEGMGAHTDA